MMFIKILGRDTSTKVTEGRRVSLVILGPAVG